VQWRVITTDDSAPSLDDSTQKVTETSVTAHGDSNVKDNLITHNNNNNNNNNSDDDSTNMHEQHQTQHSNNNNNTDDDNNKTMDSKVDDVYNSAGKLID